MQHYSSVTLHVSPKYPISAEKLKITFAKIQCGSVTVWERESSVVGWQCGSVAVRQCGSVGEGRQFGRVAVKQCGSVVRGRNLPMMTP